MKHTNLFHYHSLTDGAACKQELRRLLNGARDAANDHDRLVLVKPALEIVDAHMPQLREALRPLTDPHGPVAVVIDGLPFRGREDLEAAKLFHLGIAFQMGEPFQYRQQNGGCLAAELKPVQGHESIQAGTCRDELSWHTDDAILGSEHRCEWLSLQGLINESQAPTGIAPLDAIAERLSSASLRALMEGCSYLVRSSDNYPFTNVVWSKPRNVLWRNGHGELEGELGTYTRPVDGDLMADKVLNEFREAADAIAERLRILPGVLVVFKNARVLHNRAAFEGDRLLTRVYIRSDLRALRRATGAEENEYVFDARLLLLHE